MTTFGFQHLSIDQQLEFLRRKGLHLQSLIRGNFIISLYWSENLIFEVFILRNNGKVFEIKCYERHEYL
jgi:hypothetical protein